MKKLLLMAVLLFCFKGFAQISDEIVIKNTQTSGEYALPDLKQDILFIHKAPGLTVNLKIIFPADPKDGQKVTIASTGGITTLVLNISGTRDTIMNMLGTMGGGGNATWQYCEEFRIWVKRH